MKFFSFLSFLFVVLVMLSLTLVWVICSGCDVVSCRVLTWIYVWFARVFVAVFNLSWLFVAVFNLSWLFGDCSVTSLSAIEFDSRFIDVVVIAFW